MIPHAVLAHHLHQHAFAQAAVGDAQPLARKGAADRFENGAAGEHQIGALRADAGVGDAVLVAHGEQPLDHGRDLCIVHPAAVDAAALVARQFEIDAGDRRHRAGRAEQMHALDRAAVLRGEAVDVLRDLRDHRLEAFARDRDAAVTLGQRHDAHRQRNPGFDLRMRRTVLDRRHAAEPHQFRRAAADVEQDHALRRRIDQRRAAGRRKPRLGLAIDDLKLDADLLAHPRQEFVAVAGGAAGFGRDQPRPGDAAVADLVAADAQRIDRARDRRFAQHARTGDALAQPDDARERIDHAEAVAGRARHQEPAIVGAEIERSIGRTGQVRPARAVVARVAIWRPPAPPVRHWAPDEGRGRGRSPGPRRPLKTFPHAEARRPSQARRHGGKCHFAEKCSSGSGGRNSGGRAKHDGNPRLCL